MAESMNELAHKSPLISVGGVVTGQRGETGIWGKGISNCIVLVCVIPNRVPCEVKVASAGVK